MVSTGGLKFRKVDLHVHAKGCVPGDIVKAAIGKGLSAIAITDHQTGDYVDAVKKSAKGTGLVVFPGVEIMANGGKKGLHVLALFYIDKDTNHVNNFLTRIDIYEKDGKTPVATEKGVGKIADELEEFDPTAILSFAHCQSSKGVTGDVAGEVRNLIFDKERKCLLGAETSESNFANENLKEKRARVVDCFDGKDPNYGNKKLGVYISSDAKSPDEIGTSFTYFKVDDDITIEDIRQALIDRDTRIRQFFEYKEQIYPRIDTLTIEGGFLADQKFCFHEGLNSILGSKGCGKSLVVEFLRFALNRQPDDVDLRADHDLKLEKCLKLHGEVKVKFTDSSGKSYLVTRIYNPAEGNPLEIIDLSDDIKKDFQIEQVFPVLFLSQNEVVKIAQDNGGASQRSFIDRFFDFYKYQGKIEALNKDLSVIDGRVADVLRSRLIVLDLKRKIASCNEEVTKLGRQIKNSVFEKYSKKESVGQGITGQLNFLKSLKGSLSNTKGEYGDLLPTTADEEKKIFDPAVKRAMECSEKIVESIGSGIDGFLSELDKALEEVNKEYSDWRSSFEPIKKEYDETVAKEGATQMELDQQRKRLLLRLSALEGDLVKHNGKAGQARRIFDKRKGIVEKLDSTYKDYFEERQKRCTYFTERSSDSLNVSIREREDTSAFLEQLTKLKRGSWLKDEDIEKIVDNISPQDFVINILRYEWGERGKIVPLKYISSKTGIEVKNVEKLLHYMLDSYSYIDILALSYDTFPNDVPSIKYKVGADFKDLDELSVGQKATALLIIALSDSKFPVVVDQPEDSLDLVGIWHDVCVKLRETKDNRQFILTTHNSSVAVASDTDKFTILEATATNGKVLCSGAMNNDTLKKNVIDYLEGGKTTYHKKRKKYNL